MFLLKTKWIKDYVYDLLNNRYNELNGNLE